MKPLRVLDALKLPAGEIQPCDCGTCPVTLACAVEQGGNGYTFACCHATGVEVEQNGRTTLLMVDCGIHRFEKNQAVDSTPECPMCSGFAVDIELRELGLPARWVPTVHARVPVQTRLDGWRAALVAAEKRLADHERRKKAG